MKIAIVSDIHCNIGGLEKALELMSPYDQLWCAGDSVFQFRWSNDVVGRLRELGARVILGNHEETILSRDGERAISSPKVDQDLVAWMREKTYRVEEVVDGKTVVMTHGSPWEPWKEYHYPHEAIWSRASEMPCDLLIVGHTHFKMAQRHGRCLVVNPGSAGDPRDHRNEFQLSCAVWDTATTEVEFFDYPDPTRNFAMSSGSLR
ncbi:MAG: metallophosphoesterase family protein [Dehalococcoidia bacterium]